jgi:hypothetical protein
MITENAVPIITKARPDFLEKSKPSRRSSAMIIGSMQIIKRLLTMGPVLFECCIAAITSAGIPLTPPPAIPIQATSIIAPVKTAAAR